MESLPCHASADTVHEYELRNHFKLSWGPGSVSISVTWHKSPNLFKLNLLICKMESIVVSFL